MLNLKENYLEAIRFCHAGSCPLANEQTGYMFQLEGTFPL